MDALVLIIASISSILSSGISLMYAYIAYKKSKEPPKDDIWETATRILCSSEGIDKNADEFAMIYESLRLFKDNNCSKNGILSLEYAVRDKNIGKEELQ